MEGPMKILNPSGYITQHGLAFADATGAAIPVSDDHPLPVSISLPSARPSPLSGTTNQSILSSGFAPVTDRPIWLTLSGIWTGTVSVRRSSGPKAPAAPLTIGGKPWGIFDRNAMEPIGEESIPGAVWYLDIALAGGTLTYEVRQ
ncbi:hypothetical protein EV664_108162 [Stakelama pacifica]|uniref:Uncharacterized protein n=2 Tax=Stakelama pacifica TaxID=517720 RepID=A0A4R6FK05_9SPHN|nr:hypothetical protein EV664_108162 [Stakelama pacifica]GGO97108.1 hypothetical protein GCM10011329_25190 [Stakelama pacifica]